MDDKLRWNEHIQKLGKKLSCTAGALRRCAYYISDKYRRVIYYSVIESHLRYLIVCWGNTAGYLLNNIQRIQNKCIKFLYNLEYRTPTVQLYNITLEIVSI